MARDPTYCVYMMCNKWRTVIYTGVSNDLLRRVVQHRSGTGSVFAKRYNVDRLVYFETTDDAYSAIAREKQIKAGSRAKKIALIESQNPDWKDLFDELMNGSR